MPQVELAKATKMENKYIEKVAEIIVRESTLEKSAAPFATMARAARRTVKAFGKGIAQNSRQLADDVKGLVRPNSAGRMKSKSFLAKSIARNPVAQAGVAATAGAVGASMMSSKKNDK